MTQDLQSPALTGALWTVRKDLINAITVLNSSAEIGMMLAYETKCECEKSLALLDQILAAVPDRLHDGVFSGTCVVDQDAERICANAARVFATITHQLPKEEEPKK